MRSILALFLLWPVVLMASDWAIVVGISDYKNPEIPDLKYTAKDAKDFFDVLVTYCGFDPENVILLINSEATKDNIEAAFAEVARKARKNDKVVIYFSGHGSFVRDTDGDEEDGLDEVFVPYDAIPGHEETLIIDDIFGYWVNRIRSKSVVIILDACHSGGQGKSTNIMNMPVRGSGDAVVKDIFTISGAKPGRALLASSLPGQVSYEDPKLKHGVFTHFLLQGIKTGAADVDGDGIITVDELADYVKQKVENWAEDEGLLQTPLYEKNPMNLDIVIAAPKPVVPEPVVPEPAFPEHRGSPVRLGISTVYWVPISVGIFGILMLLVYIVALLPPRTMTIGRENGCGHSVARADLNGGFSMKNCTLM